MGAWPLDSFFFSCTVITQIQIMEGPISDSERTRFVWYAQHIRSMCLKSDHHIDPTVFLCLARARLGTPLTPRLRALYTNTYGPPYLDIAIGLLAGITLRELTLTLAPALETRLPLRDTRHQYAPRVLLAELTAAAPALEYLEVRACSHASLLEPIGAFRSLKKLALWKTEMPFGMPLLQALARLEELELLELPNTFDVFTAAPCRGLKKLRALTVTGGMRTVPALLNSLPDLRLNELQLFHVVCEEMAPLEALAAALRAGPGVKLEHLRLQDFTGGPALTDASVSTLFQEFFALGGIRRFNLSSDQTLNIQNDDLRKIGLAWPKLQQLCVQYDTRYAREFAAPTIWGIILLANKCPELDDVYFSAVMPSAHSNSTVAPLRTEEFRDIVLNLCIPDERIRDVRQIARVLHSALGGKIHHGELDKGHYGRWSAVLEHMETLPEPEEYWDLE